MTSVPTSARNDAPFSSDSASAEKRLNYTVIAQSADEVQEIQNAPSISMGPWLIATGQTRLLTILSIYSQRGSSRDQVRLFYMNATALRIWKEMGRVPTVLSTVHRPPHEALLTWCVPFSD